MAGKSARPDDETHTLADGVSVAAPDAGPRIAVVVRREEGVEVAVLRPGSPLVIGRAPASGLRIDDRTLSREHARFELRDGRVLVEDLGSKNGVHRAGQRVRRCELGPGDEVVLGAARARIEALGAAGDPLGTDGDEALRPAEEDRAGGVAGSRMRAVIDTALRVAASRIPVVLHGETGTGKELLARLLHENSPRRARRIVRVNCGAIPRDLVESTLFGHEKGAFTGWRSAPLAGGSGRSRTPAPAALPRLRPRAAARRSRR